MNRFACGVLLITLGLLLQNSVVFSGVAEEKALEAKFNDLGVDELLSKLGETDLFRSVDNVFLKGFDVINDPVYDNNGVQVTYKISANISRPVFSRLAFGKLLRYGVSNFARNNAADSIDLPYYWRDCMRVYRQLRNFVDVVQFSFYDYSNGEKVNLFKSLIDQYDRSNETNVIPYLVKSYNQLSEITPAQPGGRAAKNLILAVNKKLQEAFNRIVTDYEKLKKLPPQEKIVRPKEVISQAPDYSGKPEDLVARAVEAWENVVRDENETSGEYLQVERQEAQDMLREVRKCKVKS